MFSRVCKKTLVRKILSRKNKDIQKQLDNKIHKCVNHNAFAISNPNDNTIAGSVCNNWTKMRGELLYFKRFSSSSDNVVCWSCEKINSMKSNPIFCMHCNTIQKPRRDANYFEVIGIDKDFIVDEAALSLKYKNLQKHLHPDKFSLRDKSEQEISAEYSSLVNKAYSTLIQPLSRGIYLLKLNGHEISEETQVESKFLHEIMERNEEVEEAETAEEVLKINKENKEVLAKLSAELSSAFNSGNLNSAKNILIRMKYFVSIENQIKDMIRQMQIVE